MSVKTIFTALGDQVRRLAGRTDKMSVEVMTEALAGITLGVDASGLTASASDVIKDKTFIGSSGGVQAGTMVNNGAVSATLDTTTKSYTVPPGYHNGNGKVQIVTQTKSVTPKSTAQTVYPDSGKLLSAVTVGAAQAGGGYTGRYTTTFGTTGTISIDTGVALSESDIFILCPVMTEPNSVKSFDNYYYAYQFAISAVRLSASEQYFTNIKTEGFMENEDLYGKANILGNGKGTDYYVNYSGSTVTMRLGVMPHHLSEYQWILIKK